MKNKLFALAVFFLFVISAQAQVAKSVKGTFALTNATIETVTKGTITNGTLIIKDGKITALGTNVNVPAGATTIDCTGHTIYPGMIDGNTQLGLAEVNSVSLTVDHNEIGEVKPHMQALTAVNPNNTAIPVTRVSGVTTVMAVPTSGIIPGTAALINLVGYNPDQMYAGYKAVVMNFPSASRRGRRDRRSPEDVKKAYEKSMKSINDLWDQVALFDKVQQANEDVDYNPALEAMIPVMKGEMNLHINVNSKDAILNALKWVKEKEMKNVVLVGVSEGWRVAKEIAEAGIPVITGPVQSTPTRASDRYDRPYANAGVMSKAGVKVAITSGETENVRNLPFNAGFAAAYGMGKKAALEAVTINPAQIFGVADKIGSLEVGKDANLFVATGDPFETKTKIAHLFIGGYQIAIDSRHIQLYHEFLERSPGVKK
ncbi:MAG: amidohydrolase family protein [Saprospiraceae bacterium]